MYHNQLNEGYRRVLINYIVFNRIQTYFESNIFNFDSLDGIVLFQNSINFYENNLDVKNFLVNNLILKFSTIERLKPDILKSVDKLKFYFDELIIKILVEKIIPLLEETKNVPRFLYLLPYLSLISLVNGVKEYLKKSQTSLMRFKNTNKNSDKRFSGDDFCKIHKQLEIDVLFLQNKMCINFEIQLFP
ncbi:hypothetical protein HZS_5586 [Henneguya salminicola]|nr:hypothetical protein HZS_5586 [Henneguya salminicola]